MTTIKIQPTELSEAINIAPLVATSGSAGADLKANIACTSSISPSEIKMIPTGIKIAIPEGYFGLLSVRSGLSKKGICLANGVGIIDSDYRGEVKIPLINHSDELYDIQKNERIAQLILIPYLKVSFEVVEEIDTTTRGSGGFGSTG